MRCAEATPALSKAVPAVVAQPQARAVAFREKLELDVCRPDSVVVPPRRAQAMRRVGFDDAAARNDLSALGVSPALRQPPGGAGIELEIRPPGRPVLVVHDRVPHGEHRSRKGDLEPDRVRAQGVSRSLRHARS